MSDPPEPLLQGQGWAKKAIAFVKASPTSVADALLWSSETIPTTSLFSGACYPERALHYIDSARSEGAGGPALTDSLVDLCPFRCIYIYTYNIYIQLFTLLGLPTEIEFPGIWLFKCRGSTLQKNKIQKYRRKQAQGCSKQTCQAAYCRGWCTNVFFIIPQTLFLGHIKPYLS